MTLPPLPEPALRWRYTEDQMRAYGAACAAAERARISGAPVAILDTRDALGLCAPTEADFQGLYALQGHRVALVDLGLEVMCELKAENVALRAAAGEDGCAATRRAIVRAAAAIGSKE